MSTPLESNTAADRWPAGETEDVRVCPYCGSPSRSLAYADVEDWAFGAAPGRWQFWECGSCASLYLSPRPTLGSIGLAYRTYYTHTAAGSGSWRSRGKQRLTHEAWAAMLAVDVRPRLGLPLWSLRALRPLVRRLLPPFGYREIATRPAGVLVDVGCGDGETLRFAHDLGWRGFGLELDPAAVAGARARGLDVRQGSYEALRSHPGEFDVVVCSHVLEHVFEPLEMLETFRSALKPGGVLLLSLPNAGSVVRSRFGRDWRGLEAPRHLSIPTMQQLRRVLERMGFAVVPRSETRPWTTAQSVRIRRRGATLTTEDKRQARQLAAQLHSQDPATHDFIEFECLKLSAEVPSRIVPTPTSP